MLYFDEWLKLNESKEYVVYTITLKGNKLPSYVGSGTRERSYVSLSTFIDKHGESEIEYIGTYSSIDSALKKEIELTNKYKIKSEGGSLLNMRIGNTPTDDLKKKHSESLKGKKKSKEHRNNISNALKDTQKTDTHKNNISDSLKGNKNAQKD